MIYSIIVMSDKKKFQGFIFLISEFYFSNFQKPEVSHDGGSVE